MFCIIKYLIMFMMKIVAAENVCKSINKNTPGLCSKKHKHVLEMCVDTPGFDYYDYCPYSCCDESEDDFCCKHAAPIVGAIISVAVITSVIVATFCCCRRQKASPGSVITARDINLNTIIETGLHKAEGKHINHCPQRDLTRNLEDKNPPENNIMQISKHTNITLVNEYQNGTVKHEDILTILNKTPKSRTVTIAPVSITCSVSLPQTSLNWNVTNASFCSIGSVYGGNLNGDQTRTNCDHIATTKKGYHDLTPNRNVGW